MVTYGNASRLASTPVAPRSLLRMGQSVIGFFLYEQMRPARIERDVTTVLAELVDMVASGRLQALPGHSYPLADAARAFHDMRDRRTTGKVVLVP